MFPQPPPSPQSSEAKEPGWLFFLDGFLANEKTVLSTNVLNCSCQLPSHKAFSWSSCSSQLCLIQRFGCSYFVMLHSLETHCSLSPLPADIGSFASSILLLFLENFFLSCRCLGNQCGSSACCPSSKQRGFKKTHWPSWATHDAFYEQMWLHQSEAHRSKENTSTVQTPLISWIFVLDPNVQHPLQPHIPLPYKYNLPAMLHQAIWGIDDIIKISQKTGSRFVLKVPWCLPEMQVCCLPFLFSKFDCQMSRAVGILFSHGSGYGQFSTL